MFKIRESAGVFEQTIEIETMHEREWVYNYQHRMYQFDAFG